nr:NADH dehydrogenase subunit 3 [Borysthenes sp. 2 WQW-2023a]
MKILSSTILITMVTLLIMNTLFSLSKKTNMDRKKSSPFECGFSPMSKARMSFSIHFFMMAIMFLIFDIETSIILPSSIMMKNMKMIEWVLTTTMILLTISYGLYHEWTNKILEWSK